MGSWLLTSLLPGEEFNLHQVRTRRNVFDKYFRVSKQKLCGHTFKTAAFGPIDANDQRIVPERLSKVY